MANPNTGSGGRYYMVDGKRITEQEFLARQSKSKKSKSTQKSEVKADE